MPLPPQTTTYTTADAVQTYLGRRSVAHDLEQLRGGPSHARHRERARVPEPAQHGFRMATPRNPRQVDGDEGGRNSILSMS